MNDLGYDLACTQCDFQTSSLLDLEIHEEQHGKFPHWERHLDQYGQSYYTEIVIND